MHRAPIDTTQAIIRFWRLCLPSEASNNGGDGAIRIEVLKVVVGQELSGKLEALGFASVDELLWAYMQPDSAGLVGFLQYWQGMEQILERIGCKRTRLTSAKQHAVEGFHFLRTCILEMSTKGVSQNRSVFQVRELRYFIERTITVAGEEGEAYWRAQAASLPADDVCVTGEEVASALLTWLEELVHDDGQYDAGGPPAPQELNRYASGTSGRSGRTSLSSSMDEDCDSEDSVDEGNAVTHRRPLQPFAPVPSTGAVGSRARPGGADQWQPQSVSLPDGLRCLLQRLEKKPGILTKESAGEWRDGIAFNVALKRALQSASEDDQAFTLQSLYLLASEHFAANQRRRPQREAASSPVHLEKLHWRAVNILYSTLQGLVLKRKALGFSGWLALRRHGASAAPAGGPAVAGAGTIFRELLRSQCETALELEAQERTAARAGGLVLCIASLQRAKLKGAWMELCQLLPKGPAGSPGRDAPCTPSPPASGGGGGGAGPRSPPPWLPAQLQAQAQPSSLIRGETQQLAELMEALKR